MLVGVEERPEVGKLYDVRENEGKFYAVLPGLIDPEGRIWGTQTREFEKREEAEAAVAAAQEWRRAGKELKSLEGGFVNHQRIAQTDEGRFRVVFPALIHMETGYMVGTSYRDFDTWDEASECYLRLLERKTQLIDHPIWEITVGDNHRVAFSELDAFDPQVTPSREPQTVPDEVRDYALPADKVSGRIFSAATYEHTIAESSWETGVFRFVVDFIGHEGAEIAADIGITDLRNLTPAQAIKLATSVVFALTKYKTGDATEADQMTALELLQEGRRRREEDDWEGNGVCRNFASITKAVFEAIRANQGPLSRLNDTYCLFENGDEFAMRRKDHRIVDPTGHAWNTFVTISNEGVNMTVVDVTWARQDLDTRKVEGLDHTLTRMEPTVFQIGTRLHEGLLDQVEQLTHVVSYYELVITRQIDLKMRPIEELSENEKQRYRQKALELFGDSEDETALIIAGQRYYLELRFAERIQFFCSRLVTILGHAQELPNIPAHLLQHIEHSYLAMATGQAEITEIETLRRLADAYPTLQFQEILAKFLGERRQGRELITRSDELQRLIIMHIRDREDFSKLLQDPQFRVRVRELFPELLDRFDPGTNPADARELDYLVKRSTYLKRAAAFVGNPTRLYASARKALVGKPEVDSMSDYEVIRQFDRLYEQRRN